MWNAAKRLAGEKFSGPPTKIFQNGVQVNSPDQISNLLNENFIKKIVDIREEMEAIPNRDDPLTNYRRMVDGMNLENTFTINTIDARDLRRVVNAMKSTRSTGLDGLSMKLLKEYLPYIGRPVLNLVNHSIVECRFPGELKTSKIVANYKARQTCQ